MIIFIQKKQMKIYTQKKTEEVETGSKKIGKN